MLNVRHLCLTVLLVFTSGVPVCGAAGQQLWSIPFTLVAAPAVRDDGTVVAQSAETLLMVSSDGSERWRVAVSGPTSNSAQPPLIDDQGNIVVLTSTGLSSFDANGTLRWSFALPYASSYTSLALAHSGDVIVKSADEWYALNTTGQTRWKIADGAVAAASVTVGDPFGPYFTASPAVIAPDGTVRSVDRYDRSVIRSAMTGERVASDAWDSAASPYSGAFFLGVGPFGESLIVAGRQPPQLDPIVPYLETPSAGNFRVRWSQASGTGQSWSNPFVLGDPSSGPIDSTERPRHGLCAPSGEVLIATTRGTVIMPHAGIGSRRWAESAFAVAANGDVLCSDGTRLVARHQDQTIAWSAPAEGSRFTLAPNGRVYGGDTSLSAYDAGVAPASGPWTQPRGDAAQRARATAAFGPFQPNVVSAISAPTTLQLYATYAGQIAATPYVQGPGTLVWEKDGADAGAPVDDYSFVVRSASAADAGNYRLRIETQNGTVRSEPIQVSVVDPSAIRPGLYWGTHRAPSNELYCLEIRPDRSVRYLSSGGARFTPAMNVRLNPTGAYPWALRVPQSQANITLQATTTGVTVSWQDGVAEPAIPASAALASGARTGWYDGNYVGPLNDQCVTELALLPDGTLIGAMSRQSGNASLWRVALDPAKLTQDVRVNPSDPVSDQLNVSFDTSGHASFGLQVFPYRKEPYARFEAYAPGSAPETRLVNLSVRSVAGGPTGTLIAGFVAAAPGEYLIRGVGPTLADVGLANVLARPALTVRLPNGTLIGENQGWSTIGAAGIARLTDAADRTGAFHLRSGSMDSALIAALTGGSYTALISSVDEGMALGEVYTMPAAANEPPPRLVNLSARGQITARNPAMIVGFVHATDAARRILIRGVGPGLKPFVGNTTVCANPRLRVYDKNRAVIAENADWNTSGARPSYYGDPSQVNTVTSAAAAAGAFPLTHGSQDAALVLNLPGGQYTVELESEDARYGEILFEVYAVP